MRRGTPSRSITSIARGSAASLDVVENAMTAGSLTALTNLRTGTPKMQRDRQQHDAGMKTASAT